MSTPTRAGWYDDPDDAAQLRYFDGVVWTENRTPRAAPPRPTQATPPTAPGTGTYAAGLPYTPPAPPQAPGAPGGPGAPGQQQWQQPGPPAGPQSGQAPYGGYPQGGWNTPLSHVTVPSTPDGVALAGYWQRVGAFLLDWVIQLAIGLVLGGYFLFQAFQDYFAQVDAMRADIEAGRDPDFTAIVNSIDLGQATIYSVLAIAVFFVYQYVFLSRSGQTPGKMVVGISVREQARPGVPSTSAVLRRVGASTAIFVLQLVPLISLFSLPIRALDLLWPAWDTQKQALHDKAAGTCVVVGKQPRP